MKQNSKIKLIFLLSLFLVSSPFILWLIPEILQIPLRAQKKSSAIVTAQLFETYSAIKAYYADYGKYPSSEEWCNLILPYIDKNYEHIFTSQKIRIALNPNAKPDSPDDVVLLFESTYPSWNANGHSELLAPTSKEKPGCFVLFNDGQIKFVTPEYIKKLNWGNKP